MAKPRSFYFHDVLFVGVLLSLAAAISSAAEPASSRVRYSLQGLKPLGVSAYSVHSRSAQREYIHFRNAQGNHYLIYEEATGAPPAQAIKHFREVMGKWDMVCSVDLDCKMAAFCTGTCKNLYYETSNTPQAPELKERNHCEISSYHCEKPPLAASAGGNP